MQRFVLAQNVARFERILAGELGTHERVVLEGLLMRARHDLARLDADLRGICAGAVPTAGLQHGAAEILRRVRGGFERAPQPRLLLHPGPGLNIIDINDAYARVTMTAADKVAGQPLFDVFPDNPDDPAADGVSNLYASLRKAAGTGRPHAMAIQRYDIRDASGQFLERYWQPVNTPILNDAGYLVCLLHHVEDVTERVRAAQFRPTLPAAE